jgi:hypothetical protein
MTQLGRDASVYWGTTLVGESRNAVIDMGSDFVDDTVHRDVNRSFQPTFSNFGLSITGLMETGAVATNTTASIMAAALAKTSGTFSVYFGASQRYVYGTGFVSVDEIGQPYEDFDTFNWSLRSAGGIGSYWGALG